MLKKISFYLSAGFIAGLFLGLIEIFDRVITLKPFLFQSYDLLLFIAALLITPIIMAIFGLKISVACIYSDLIIAKTLKANTEKKFRISEILLKTASISLPWILIAIIFPSIITNGFNEILSGVIERVAALGIVLKYTKLILIAFILSVSLLIAFIDHEKILNLITRRWLAILLGLGSIVITLATYYIDAYIFVGRYYYFFHIPLILISTATSLLLGIIVIRKFPLQKRALVIFASIITAIVALGTFNFTNHQTVKSLFWHRGVIARKYLDFAQHIIDLDRDGFSKIFGGGDCNDLDRNINPLAKEDANSSLDKNCFGAKTEWNEKQFTILNQEPVSPLVKNVLFITIDCLRADHLSAYGYERNLSPKIDQFAAKSILFENGYSLGTNTGHSFSSMARSSHGEAIFDDDIPTIAETFAANGYLTAAITSPKTVDWLKKQGWESYKNIMLKGIQTIVHNTERNWNSRRLTDETIQFLTGHQDKPFYLWVHYNDLHAKNEKYKKSGKHEFGKRPVDLYDANIAFTDDHLGRLLEYLETSGLLNSTIVAISADHGEEFLEHGQQFHNGRLYREQTHVPMILWYPQAKAARITTPVSAIDFGPTFLRAAGIMPSTAYAGVDLLKTVEGKTQGRYILIETPRNVPQADFFAWAIIDNNYRLIYDLVGNTYELYDDKADPLERKNLFDTEQTQAAKMKGVLASWFDYESQHKNYRYWLRF